MRRKSDVLKEQNPQLNISSLFVSLSSALDIPTTHERVITRTVKLISFRKNYTTHLELIFKVTIYTTEDLHNTAIYTFFTIYHVIMYFAYMVLKKAPC